MTIRRGREAVGLLSGEACGDEANVICPACGSNQAHVFQVGTLVDVYEVIPPVPGESPAGRGQPRRSVVEIVFRCEHCPHHFALVLEQYQGHLLLVVREEVPNFTD
jgi:hypothetical protein